MRTIVSALLALSVLTGIAATASADTALGPPPVWQPQDVSKSPN